MSTITNTLRARRQAARTRRALNRAINTAATPSMRDELIIVAQRHSLSR